jgi:hypothetical protein
VDNKNWIRANIHGASQLADWFEYWPLFHDAEVTELHFDRSGTSWLKVHTWHTTNETISSHFITNKHVVVTFKLQDIQELELSEFNGTNVIHWLKLNPVEHGIELQMEPCMGVFGRIAARQMEIEFLPGKPVDRDSTQPAENCSMVG